MLPRTEAFVLEATELAPLVAAPPGQHMTARSVGDVRFEGELETGALATRGEARVGPLTLDEGYSVLRVTASGPDLVDVDVSLGFPTRGPSTGFGGAAIARLERMPCEWLDTDGDQAVHGDHVVALDGALMIARTPLPVTHDGRSITLFPQGLAERPGEVPVWVAERREDRARVVLRWPDASLDGWVEASALRPATEEERAMASGEQRVIAGDLSSPGLDVSVPGTRPATLLVEAPVFLGPSDGTRWGRIARGANVDVVVGSIDADRVAVARADGVRGLSAHELSVVDGRLERRIRHRAWVARRAVRLR